MMTSWGKKALLVSRSFFGPAAVLFLAIAGWQARHIFAGLVDQASPALMLAALLLWMLLHPISPVFSWIVLNEMGAHLPYRVALRIHVQRLPARYLPGGVWHTVTRVIDLHDYGISKAHLTFLLVLENTIPVAVALLLGGTLATFSAATRTLGVAALLAGTGTLAIIPVLLRHRALRQHAPFRLVAFGKLICISAAFWLVATSAFACYWSGFGNTAGDSILKVAAAYLLGWAAGFLAIFAPQGIGVFETVISALLAGALPFAGVAVLAAGFRALSIVADALVFTIQAGARALARKRVASEY